jgi:hypothetical protein
LRFDALLGNKKAIILTTAGIIAGLLFVVASLYLGSDTRSCGSCHDQADFVEATEASAHSTIACTECHAPRGRLQAVSVTARHVVPSARQGRTLSEVDDAACLACHEPLLKKTTESLGLRIQHSTCTEGSTCTDCHSTTAHGDATGWPRTYEMEKCMDCHAARASVKCDVCHEGRRAEERVASGVFAVTHGPDWRKTHGMGNSKTCAACHTAASCEKCHGPGVPHDAEYVKRHAEDARSDGAKCDSCHETAFCNDCHGTPMPHSRKFTRTHAAEATKNKSMCNRCHAPADCSECHVKHVHPGGAVGKLAPGSVQ